MGSKVMFLDNIEFKDVTSNHKIEWKKVVDDQIDKGKSYLISDRQFYFNGQSIDVVEELNGRYRKVATRKTSSKYMSFDVKVAKNIFKKGQKQLLLHRARLTAFVGLDPNKPLVCHGKLGRENNDLSNLQWGTHIDNMNHVKQQGTMKGVKNPQSKIKNENFAVAIYVISNLNLITQELKKTLPIKNGAIDSIRSRNAWRDTVTDDIVLLVENCKNCLDKIIMNRVQQELRVQEKKHQIEIKALKDQFKKNIKNFYQGILNL